MGFSTKGVMRIVVNALSARQGGGQTYLINLLQSFPERFAAEIFILAPDSLSLPLSKKRVTKIQVTWPVENPFTRAIWEWLYLPKLLKQRDADVLFCPGGIIGGRDAAGCHTGTVLWETNSFRLG